MQATLILMSFGIISSLLTSNANAATRLGLSQRDSASFSATTRLPTIALTTTYEGGLARQNIERQYSTSDQLLTFNCNEISYEGLEADLSCSVSVDLGRLPSTNNQVQAYTDGSVRTLIQNTNDMATLNSVFANAGACQASSSSLLYASQERRDITLPDGRVTAAPLLTISCAGNGRIEFLDVVLSTRSGPTF